MNYVEEHLKGVTRRHFLQQCHLGIGGLALGALLGGEAQAAGGSAVRPLAAKTPPLPVKAKRIIFLHLAGAPSQLDLFDYKPKLVEQDGKPCPEEFFKNQRFAFVKDDAKLLGTRRSFAQHGQSGAWFSDLVPKLASVADELTIVRSLTTTQFNHAPAQLYLHTGNSQLGHASLGSWVTYGLGTENQDLPGFVVLVSGGTTPSAGKSVWGSGYLPGVYQGVQCRTSGDPILHISNPPGMDRAVRRNSLDALADLNRMQAEEFGAPETLARIQQYELAYRMQATVPEVMDITRESASTLQMYGAQPGKASFANNCLLARRLVEQGVRFVQLYDWGWDSHGTGKMDDLVHSLPMKCGEVDQPSAALILDLKQRGLLEDTLVILGGEFGRTSMNEERNGSTFLGRDHHPHAFTMLFAGGGMKPGTLYGATDELGYFVTENKMTVRDLQATILHLMGLDAHRLVFPLMGLDQRLIGPEGKAEVHSQILA